jgi:hypothetical protein
VPHRHYRTSTDVGLAMGRQVGTLAAAKVAQSPAEMRLATGGAAAPGSEPVITVPEPG